MPEAVVGHFKLLEQIGTGALGDVYRARDTKLGRTVAIRLPSADLLADPARRRELLGRAREVARLSHPAIATLFEVGEEDDRLYLVFEYVPGETLSRVIAGHPINPRRAVEFAVQLADGLADAHAEGLVHGDIRPETIIVTPKDRAKLLDFGMAAFTRGDEAAGRTLNASDDILALVGVLFEMLTGKRAFRPGTDLPEPRLGTIPRSVPSELDPIMTRALAPDRQARYQSAATLSAELRGVAAVLDIRTAAHEAEFIDDVPSAAGQGVRWVLALLVLGAAVAGLWGWRDQAQLQWRRWFGPPPAPTLVVMPFEVEGTMPTITADAVADDLQNRLGMIDGLKVVSRSLLRSERGREPRTVARAAGAAVALVGTIRGTGDQVAMDLTLVDAMSGATLWTRTMSSTKRGLFGAESTLTGEVAGAFGLAPPNGAAEARAASRTVDAAAYDLYARGRDAESRGDLTGAGSLYEQAIMADSSLAEAYSALATVSYRDMMRSARWDDGAAWARIRQSAENATTADPDLPAAQLAEALAARTMKQALPLFARGIAMDPSRGETYAELAGQIGDFDPSRASALYRAALALDAGRAESLAGLAESSIRLDRFQEADTGITRGRQLHPTFSRWSYAQAYGEMARGRFPGAVTALRDPATRTGDPAAGLLYVRALAGSGSVPEARDEAARLVQLFPDYCEARATWAGLLFDAGKPQDARREAERIFAGAAPTDAEPGRVGCAAVAAAALGQADEAGRWLRRTAAAEPSLRMWALQGAGRGLTRKWYPWTKVAASPAVTSGVQALEAAYASLRQEVATVLPTTEESQQSSR